MKIWITRGSARGLISRGLGNVFVWFHEPCLDVDDSSTEMFSLENTIRDDLHGILYDKNIRYNFVYRSANDVKSSFGTKLIRNDDGIDFPIKLVDFYENNRLVFKHKVFGDGPKSNYIPNSTNNIFGYDTPISDKIWQLVCDDFDGIEFRQWDKHDNAMPWWNFCKEIEIEITLI